MQNKIKSLIKKLFTKKQINKITSLYNILFGFNHISIPADNKFIIGKSKMRKCTINVHGKNNSIIFGDNNIFYNCKLQIFGQDCIICIGNNNTFKDSIFWLEDNTSSIIIGNGTNFCGKTHMGIVEGTSLTIGNNCLFSSEIYITTTDSHSILSKEDRRRINPSKNVVIKDHVWIGHKATILKGVEIHNNSIVGANALVSHTFNESNVIIAGNPAKIVKRGIDWEEKRVN